MNKSIVCVLLILVSLFMGQSISFANSEKALEAYCADEWPGDYVMQGHCIIQQKEAMRDYFDNYSDPAMEKLKAANLPGDTSLGDPRVPIECKIIYMCLEEWKTGKTWEYDFVMANYCCKQNFEAARKLGKIK